LAAALGVEAIRAGRTVYFSTLADIIESLAKADREGRLRERIRFLCRSLLLIIDEIGYLTVGAAAGNLFFQLVNAGYEKGAMILTSNRGFGEWGEVFGGRVRQAGVDSRCNGSVHRRAGAGGIGSHRIADAKDGTHDGAATAIAAVKSCAFGAPLRGCGT
jgi:DNA replication protein DnaC